jgi:hypothetical protein
MPQKPTAKKTDPKPAASATAGKAEKPAQTLIELLSETERTIRDLASLFSQQEGSRHLGVGGEETLTAGQKEIKSQLKDAKERYDKLLSFLNSRK